MSDRPSHTSVILRWLAVGLALAIAAVVVVLHQTRIDRELSELPVAERRALYESTLATLRGACASVTGPTLREYCQEQADFIKRFPECDSECRELAARFAPQPSR